MYIADYSANHALDLPVKKSLMHRLVNKYKIVLYVNEMDLKVGFFHHCAYMHVYRYPLFERGTK